MPDPSLINVLGAFFFFFAPYFLLFKILQLTGGIAGKVAGFAGEAGKKVDFSRNFRKSDRAGRSKRFKEGTLFNPDSKLTKVLGGRAINRVGGHIGATSGARGWQMGFGQVGTAKRANMGFTDAGTYAKEDRDFAAQINNEEAMAALAFGNNEEALRRLTYFQKKDGTGVDEAKLQGALATGRTIRVTSQSKTAAADALAKSGKIIENNDEAKDLFKAVAGGNTALESAVEGATRYTWRGVGRNDVGRPDDFSSIEEMSMAQMSSLKPLGAKNLVPKIAEVIATNKNVSGAPLTDTQKQHMVDLLYASQFNPYTNTYQQEAISKGVSAIENATKIDPNTGREVEDEETRRRWIRAGNNYRAKMGGAGDPSAPERRFAPGTPEAAAAAAAAPKLVLPGDPDFRR